MACTWSPVVSGVNLALLGRNGASQARVAGKDRARRKSEDVTMAMSPLKVFTPDYSPVVKMMAMQMAR